ncbi:MAG: Rieske (2Fe-2S) iron-sulfur domain protein, partial [Blastococcus sp.]|nr:Rieske (2Fe-2S) iron-sulfur domain protein [Blastococcus sp.]
VDIPSMGPEGTPPPRADLPLPWAVEERHGWVWVAPDRTTAPHPPRPSADVVPEPAPAPPAPAGPVFGNLDPSLEHAWHPVALSRELKPGGWLQVRLLGRTWTLRRGERDVSAEPPAFGVRERFGLVWLAPAEPVDVPLELPEAADRRFVTGWLTPERSAGPAAAIADGFLDVARFPFVHGAHSGRGGILGDADEPAGGAFAVEYEPGGFTGVRDQWFHDPTDAEMVAGRRSLRRRRRATYVYRAPLQLRLRLEFLDSGAATTILFLLQPEDVDSTRIYTRLLLSSGAGLPLPTPGTVAAAVAFEHGLLSEDRELQLVMAAAGLPLDPRDELHVGSDRLGVALRRVLGDFAAAGRLRRAA